VIVFEFALRRQVLLSWFSKNVDEVVWDGEVVILLARWLLFVEEIDELLFA
jgi:hypothetical protein